jgi:pyruvate, orthophosphate dikinase
VTEHVVRALGASPGAAEGILVVEGAQTVPQCAYVLLCREGDAEDRALLEGAQGAISLSGGLTGDLAIMARAFGKPCVVSCRELSIRDGVLHIASGASFSLEAPVCVRIDASAGTIALWRSPSKEP